MQDDRTTAARFFGVAGRPRTYLGIVYLLLGLPLGTLYLTMIVSGAAVGVSMLVVALLGIPILIGLWHVIRGFMRLECALAGALLGAPVATRPPLPDPPGGLWVRFKAYMADGPTWRGIVYLLLRFPAGVASFTVAVTLIAVSLSMTFAPTYSWSADEQDWFGWTFDPFPWSFLLVPVGVVLTFVSLHLIGWLATASGRWTQAALGGPAGEPEIDLRSPERVRRRAEPVEERVDSAR